MQLKQITLHNFLIFNGEHTFPMSDINFIKGKNGIGKTTLTLYSLLFGLYGYSSRKLEDIPSKNRSKTALVSLLIDKNKDTYKITREYPLKLNITKNTIEVELANNNEKQRYINKVFGDLQYFKKFRTIDKDEGINVIDEGATSLKRTLFSIYEDLFNEVKIGLAKEKHNREMYNKDKLNTYSHYPSEKRLDVLNKYINEAADILQTTNKDIETTNTVRFNLGEYKGKIEGSNAGLESRRNILLKNSICPACRQVIREEYKQKVRETLDIDIQVGIKLINKALEEIKKNEKVKNTLDTLRDAEIYRINRLGNLKIKLETRLRQKDFKYTEKDIVLVKEALNELDKFTSYFILKSIKSIEPIINSILMKIGFEIEFIVNDKDDIEYFLTKDKIKYSRKDLSTGQKLILQIAFKLAILLQRGESGLIIADEGMASLDEDNLLHIIDLVRGLPFQLLFVIHNCNFLPNYVHTIDLGG